MYILYIYNIYIYIYNVYNVLIYNIYIYIIQIYNNVHLLYIWWAFSAVITEVYQTCKE